MQHDSHIWDYLAILALGGDAANDNFRYDTWQLVENGEIVFEEVE